MKNKITSPQKEALKKMLLVFFYAGTSAIIPGILAYINEKPELLLLGIIINTLWAGFDKYMKTKNLTK